MQKEVIDRDRTVLANIGKKEVLASLSDIPSLLEMNSVNRPSSFTYYEVEATPEGALMQTGKEKTELIQR